MMRKIIWLAAVAGLCAGLTACGGGGGSNNSSSSGNSGTNTGTGTSTGTSSNAANTVQITVSPAGGNVRNYPMVSVTICAANSSASSNCSTVNNVLVDTGSYGLRIFASQIPSATLSGMPNVATTQTMAECTGFGSGDTWGTVRAADIKMSGEIATNLPIQVIQDSSLAASMPSGCTTGPSINTPSVLGANGILGIGAAQSDLGAGTYFSCSGTSCTRTNPTNTQVIANPVVLFPNDNNGVIVEFAQVPDSGAATATGTLVFGIDTQSNNALAGTGATILPTDGNGNMAVSFNGTSYPAGSSGAFLDSGSNGIFFNDPSLSTDSNTFFTPSSTLAMSAVLTAANSTSATVQFNVANADSLFNTGNYAFNNLAGAAPSGLDLGMPFFYGKNVYQGIAGTASTGGGTGPYVAYTSN
ncbi:DUF3443 family protein [Paraburkholderia megapolitana]|uniref:DUF3443 family protein n=1 Tax=Paraburkholderia megapolitana TaxID=420953 RepID=UPI0038BD7B35